MANLGRGFVTGANAKIKIGETTVAFCTDVSYNINIQTIPVECMGKYEVHSNEPVAYAVDGTFSILRYTNNIGDAPEVLGGESGNEVIQAATVKDHNAKGNGGREQPFSAHLDPSKILLSGTFDLDIYEKRDEAATKQFFRVKDCRITRRGASFNKRSVLIDSYAFVGILAGDMDGLGEDGKFVGISSMND